MSRRAERVTIPISPSLREVLEIENKCSLTNGYVQGNAIHGVPGRTQLGNTLRGSVLKILEYQNATSLAVTPLVFTTREAYQLVGSEWSLITPVYITGTVACATSTTVTGSGTAWLTAGVPTTGRIKFGTTDPNVAGTWYEIESVDSDMQITLTGTGPSVSGSTYVITMSFQVDFFSSVDSLDALVVQSAGVNYAIVGTNKDGMYKWSGTGQMVQMSGAAGINLKPRILASYKNSVIALATNEGGTDYWQRYRWTVVGTIDDWTSTGSGFEDIIGGGKSGRIVGQYTGAAVTVYKENSVHVINYVGGATYFKASPTSLYTGASAKEGRVPLERSTLVLDATTIRNYYAGSAQGTLDDKLAPTELDNTPDYNYLSCGAIWETYGIGLLTLPKSGTSIKTLVVGKEGDPQAWWDFTWFPTAMASVHLYTSAGSWDEDTGSWNSDGTTWDEQAYVEKSPVLVIGTYDGDVYYLGAETSSVETLTWETKAYLPEVATRVNEVRLQAQGSGGGTITLEYSTDYGESWTNLGGQVLTTDTLEYSWFPNTWGDSFRVRITASAGGLKIARPQLYIIPRRQR